MKRQNEKKTLPLGKVIGLLLVLFALEADAISVLFALALFFVPIGLAIYLIYRAVKNSRGGAQQTRCTTRQEKFDDCPQPLFCTHKDKAVHHVRRGKEIDPWDRPDIDISKYQRQRSK